MIRWRVLPQSLKFGFDGGVIAIDAVSLVSGIEFVQQRLLSGAPQCTPRSPSPGAFNSLEREDLVEGTVDDLLLSAAMDYVDLSGKEARA